MAISQALLDPTGHGSSEEDVTLSPRPGTLNGMTVGLLDNTKVNAKPLLKSIVMELSQTYTLRDSRMYTKDYFGTPVDADLLNQIIDECDVLITAIGDCGSCSAATVADGILFERAGMPTVSICSDSFFISGQAMAAVQGFPGFDFLAAAHPIASLDSEEIRDRGRALVPGIQRIFSLKG